jgi:hypothetical protein
MKRSTTDSPQPARDELREPCKRRASNKNKELTDVFN